MWQVLQRVPDRCGTPALSRSTQVRFGQQLAVPPAGSGSILVARFQWPATLKDTLDALLVHLPQFGVDPAGAEAKRFVPATAGSWHILSVPACFDWDPTFFNPLVQPPFVFAEGYPATVAKGGVVGVQFATIPFTCPSAGAAAP
jgi:hypothetical protein